MTILKKLGAVAGASALVGAGLVAFGGSVAQAADFSAVFDASYYLPGDTATLNLAGCAAGNTLRVAVGDAAPTESVVPESGVIAPVIFEIPEDVAGELGALARCIDPADNTTEVTAEAYILDQTLEANPASFPSGTPTEITAGEFIPGSDVTLRVNTQGDDAETVWSTSMGVAGDDMLVVKSVTFPTSLPCAVYDVHVSSQGAEVDNSVVAELRLCGATSSPSPTASASATPTVTPSATPSATPTKKPTKPGLPSTGA